MTGALLLHRIGPAVTVQDLGREGHMSVGLSRGGAADRLALFEGAALLGQSTHLAALEMAGYGGVFEAQTEMRIALTGAPMRASVDGIPLLWNAVHTLTVGQKLTIGAVTSGLYGYLNVGGGISTAVQLGARSAHLAANIGAVLEANMCLPIGEDDNIDLPAVKLQVSDRFQGGILRITPSAQTNRFSGAERDRFVKTTFTRSARGNRQGVQLDFAGIPFAAEAQLSILSEIIVAGDIQMTGQGIPFILLPECQTTGGYPRIGTIIHQDQPLAAQAAPGASLQFRFLTLEEGVETLRSQAQIMAELKSNLEPLIREPHEIRDLLSYQLISGVTAGKED